LSEVCQRQKNSFLSTKGDYSGNLKESAREAIGCQRSAVGWFIDSLGH
jgi:hypothetical protein